MRATHLWTCIIVFLGLSCSSGTAVESDPLPDVPDDPELPSLNIGGGPTPKTNGAPEVESLEWFPSEFGVAIAWITDEPARSSIRFGDDPELGALRVVSETLTTRHEFEIDGLEQKLPYYFQVANWDEFGNRSIEEVSTFTLADTIPPVIEDATAVQTGTTSLLFSWRTEELSTGRVEFGPTPAYGSTVELDELSNAHEVEVSGLAPGAYHYSFTSIDEAGNEAATGDELVVLEDLVPPVLSGIAAQVTGVDQVTVRWTTDERASSRVDYGLDATYGLSVADEALATEHVLVIEGLASGLSYHFSVTSVDAAGNASSSNDDVFVNLDTVPPAIEGVAVEAAGPTSANVRWTTDEPATSRVDFGLDATYGESVEGELHVTEHELLLAGLAAGEEYHFSVTSEDASGNASSTPDETFQTGDTTSPVISNVVVTEIGTDTVTVQWTTDEPASGRVDYGPTAGYGNAVFATEFTTAHQLTLQGLAAGVTYHYKVSARDEAGNRSHTPDDTFQTMPGPAQVSVTGSFVAWQPLTLDAEGPFATEVTVSPNPFLDHRFAVRFESPTGSETLVHGFFDGDGEGGANGRTWRARFAPDEAGTWNYELLFHSGDDIAVDLDFENGTPGALHGVTGSFAIAPTDPEADGFYRWGLLEYVGEHYLKFREGPYFLKGGADSPENLLGYRGFDNTEDQPGGASSSGLLDGTHRFPSHVADFENGDPLFESEDTGYSSRGIIGALNYLASVDVNSIYFLPMNLGGDGRDAYPFVGPVNNSFDKTHYDISKLRQWNMVFEHATRHGIQLHVVLNETESGNEDYLDGGSLGVQRKLFYRELSARFGHALALAWNLSEENDFSQSELESFADYIDAVDPYDHPITFHTHVLGSGGGYGDYSDVMGDPRFSASSIQTTAQHTGSIVEKWRHESGDAGHPWVINVDEIGPASEGLTDTNAADMRREALYDIYFSGGQVEWYFGAHSLPLGGDMNTEDFRTREAMWGYMSHARKFLIENVPFWEMLPQDDLVSSEAGTEGGAEVFAKRHEAYAIYFPDTTDTGRIDLSATSGTFLKSWYNPRTGEFNGSVEQVTAGGTLENGPPPDGGDVKRDWVLLYRR